MSNEPILNEIRRVRHAISARIGHDPRRILAYYADLQRTNKDRLVNLSGAPNPAEEPDTPKPSVSATGSQSSPTRNP